MSRIAGNSYDESDRRNELGFNPSINGVEDKLVEEMTFKETNGYYIKEINGIADSKGAKLERQAILEIMYGVDCDQKIADFLDKELSKLIYHRRIEDFSPREMACAYLDTMCAWSEILSEEKCELDNQVISVNKLYQGYRRYLEKYKDKLNFDINKELLSKGNFKKMLESQTNLYKRNQRINEIRIRSDSIYGLPQYKKWD